jgi:hypothetical protein
VVGETTPGIQIIENPPTAVTPMRTQISFSSYRLFVTPDRFELSTAKEDKFIELPALAIKIFSILSHTPTRALGFNYEAHWKFQESEAIILRRIFSANQENISSIFGENYEIGGKLLFNKNGCQVTLQLEKSMRFNDDVFINFNFHRDISSQETIVLIDMIRSSYHNDLHQAKTIALRLLGGPTDVWRVE